MIKEFTIEVKRVKNYQTFGLSMTYNIPVHVINETGLKEYIQQKQDEVNKIVEEQMQKVVKWDVENATKDYKKKITITTHVWNVKKK